MTDSVIGEDTDDDQAFDKRNYATSQDASVNVWRASARDGSVNAAICDQLHTAGAFYGIT